MLIACNIAIPQFLWFQACPHAIRSCSVMLSIVVNIGMWLERFVIIVTSLHRDFLPSSWAMYQADRVGLGDVHREHSVCS